MIRALARKVADFNWYEAKCRHVETGEPYRCLGCGDEYSLGQGLDPSALCDACCKRFVYDFALLVERDRRRRRRSA